MTASGYGSPPAQGRLVERGGIVLRLLSRQSPLRHHLHRCNLGKRLAEHREGKESKFVKQYGVLRLVYVESFERPDEASAREKQLKKWNRDWKIRLIETDNPEWRDLSDLLI
jgi:putative endonuclease